MAMDKAALAALGDLVLAGKGTEGHRSVLLTELGRRRTATVNLLDDIGNDSTTLVTDAEIAELREEVRGLGAMMDRVREADLVAPTVP